MKSNFSEMKKLLDEMDRIIETQDINDETRDFAMSFPLTFAKAMMDECPKVIKVAKIILIMEDYVK